MLLSPAVNRFTADYLLFSSLRSVTFRSTPNVFINWDTGMHKR